jgi:hypothetical protein
VQTQLTVVRLNRLTRTLGTQMEALKRYRTGGEQKVTVQHVSVDTCCDFLDNRKRS